MSSRLSWGFAKTASGDAVIRNWAFVWLGVAGAVACSVACYVLTLFSNENTGYVAPIVGALALLFVFNVFLEKDGVRIEKDAVVYPVRLVGDSFFCVFRKRVQVSDVVSASCLHEREGRFIIYLTGEFGEARLLVANKGNRDRFFSIFMARFPKVKIFRWR